MIPLNPELPQKQLTPRAVRRARFERKVTDVELLAIGYLLLSQTLEKSQLPVDLAVQATEMLLDELTDARAELSVSWGDESGYPSVYRLDQFAGTERR